MALLPPILLQNIAEHLGIAISLDITTRTAISTGNQIRIEILSVSAIQGNIIFKLLATPYEQSISD